MLASPLVGRNEELAFVVETLGGERPRGLVIAGGLGVGKTRLAREAAGAVDDAFAVQWVAATPGSLDIPFGALAHLLGDDPASGPNDRLRLIRSITAELERRAAGRALLLVVDDAQWLDPATAAVVHQLVVSGAATPLMTLRTDEPAPEPIVACWKDGLAERLDVQPLTRPEIGELLPAALQGPVDRVTIDRVWSLTEGNPLFVHELVRGAHETGAFELVGGVWRWAGQLGASTRLAAILESRFARVRPDAHRALDVLAVGEPLPVSILVDLCGTEALLELERAGVAVVDARDGEHVRLCHPLYGEVRRAAMGTLGQRRVMGLLASAMAPDPSIGATGLSRTQLLRLTLWNLESDTPAPASWFTEAAVIANAVYDHRLAERLARRAVADGGGFQASFALGDALNRQGRCVEGLEVLEPLAARCTTDEEHVALAVARYFGLTSEYGFRDEFAEPLLMAERQVEDPNLRNFLRAQRATLLASTGRLDQSIALASEATSGDPDEPTQLRAVPALASAWLCAGKPDSACDLTERMIEPALRHRETIPQAPAWVLSLQVPALVLAGRLDDAEAAADLIEAAVASGGGGADAPSFVALARGFSSLYRGRVHTAAEQLRESAVHMRPIAKWRLPFALTPLAEACALVGDADGAAAATAEADELVAHHAVFEGFARRARGWAEYARRQPSSAMERFLDAATWSAAHGHHTAELLSLHDLVRFGAASTVVDRLQVVASMSEGRWAPLFAAHAAAVVAHDGHALEAVADGFEQLGALLLAAEAAARASTAHAASGRTTKAERAAARAHALAQCCEGARSPVLEHLARPVPLTRREREVADLAADGLSSRAIADRLYLSVRTVEGHLQKAYDKLGVNDRAALAGILRGAR